MKKWPWVVGLVLIIVAWYLISPAFIVKEVQEESPLDFGDSLDTMSDEDKELFEEAMDAVKDDGDEMADEMPKASIVSEGEFLPRAHEVKGKAILIQDGDEKILRFEDFETINGPDLRIWLSEDLNDISEGKYVEVSKIKATKGSVNYDVTGIDTSRFKHVLVWCKPFSVLFSYATLS